MAFMTLHYFSNVLNKMTEVSAIIPERREADGTVAYDQLHAQPLKTIWLLHGLSGDATDWYRMTGLERYATEYGYAIIMPDVARSFYNNMTSGPDYWRFITEELPHRLRQLLPLSDQREDNVVIGNSMGGYGALKWGLNCPQQFAHIVALSGVVDLVDFYDKRDIFAMPDFDLVFSGQDITRKPLSLADTLVHLDNNKWPLSIYTTCGEEDALYQQNVIFSQQLADKIGSLHTWVSRPGIHDWDFWDQSLHEAFIWLDKEKEQHDDKK